MQRITFHLLDIQSRDIVVEKEEDVQSRTYADSDEDSDMVYKKKTIVQK
jgi:hypothetical protein